jgi:hypothetical protein
MEPGLPIGVSWFSDAKIASSAVIPQANINTQAYWLSLLPAPQSGDYCYKILNTKPYLKYLKRDIILLVGEITLKIFALIQGYFSVAPLLRSTQRQRRPVFFK